MLLGVFVFLRLHLDVLFQQHPANNSLFAVLNIKHSIVFLLALFFWFV